MVEKRVSKRPATPPFQVGGAPAYRNFGTSYSVHTVCKKQRILQGDQTRCEECFYTIDHEYWRTHLFTVANLLFFCLSRLCGLTYSNEPVTYLLAVSLHEWETSAIIWNCPSSLATLRSMDGLQLSCQTIITIRKLATTNRSRVIIRLNQLVWAVYEPSRGTPWDGRAWGPVV